MATDLAGARRVATQALQRLDTFLRRRAAAPLPEVEAADVAGAAAWLAVAVDRLAATSPADGEPGDEPLVSAESRRQDQPVDASQALGEAATFRVRARLRPAPAPISADAVPSVEAQPGAGAEQPALNAPASVTPITVDIPGAAVVAARIGDAMAQLRDRLPLVTVPAISTATMAAPPHYVPAAAPNFAPSPPDDLTLVAGIDAATAARLGSLGLERFSELSRLVRDDIDEIDAVLGLEGRVSAGQWIEQGAILAIGRPTHALLAVAPYRMALVPPPPAPLAPTPALIEALARLAPPPVSEPARELEQAGHHARAEARAPAADVPPSTHQVGDAGLPPQQDIGEAPAPVWVDTDPAAVEEARIDIVVPDSARSGSASPAGALGIAIPASEADLPPALREVLVLVAPAGTAVAGSEVGSTGPRAHDVAAGPSAQAPGSDNADQTGQPEAGAPSTPLVVTYPSHALPAVAEPEGMAPPAVAAGSEPVEAPLATTTATPFAEAVPADAEVPASPVYRPSARVRPWMWERLEQEAEVSIRPAASAASHAAEAPPAGAPRSTAPDHTKHTPAIQPRREPAGTEPVGSDEAAGDWRPPDGFAFEEAAVEIVDMAEDRPVLHRAAPPSRPARGEPMSGPPAVPASSTAAALIRSLMRRPD
ncbi:MAG: hypothetical protein NW205_09045 [Hyphomicrobiaceae bacterium]|nr:hypothetical protein [Hyphomicrobiaceae bacterium]